MAFSIQPKEKAEALYNEALVLIEETLTGCQSGKKIDIKKISFFIKRLIENMRICNHLFQLSQLARQSSNLIYNHSVNVCILCIQMGIALKFDDQKLENLGLAGFLHDLGISKFNRNMLCKEGKLNNSELEPIKKYPIDSYRIIKEEGQEFDWVAEVILLHHEREKGQDYPAGLIRDGIPESAKIIGLVDVFEALIHQRTSSPGLRPYEAIKEIFRSKNNHFTIDLVKILLLEVSMYPLGTKVKLNNREIGRVVGINKNQPLRPVIEILVDMQGKDLNPPKVINLAECPMLYITRPVIEKKGNA